MAAQYISILIALIMEEEIPTALYFLRMIDRGAVQEKMKGNYSRFVMSNMCRLLIGSMFLLNVFLVLAQSRHGEFLFFNAVMHCELLYSCNGNAHIVITLCVYSYMTYVIYSLFVYTYIYYVSTLFILQYVLDCHLIIAIVLGMFYDMLVALNFVSMIDDIAFQLAKLDILGNRLLKLLHHQNAFVLNSRRSLTSFGKRLQSSASLYTSLI